MKRVVMLGTRLDTKGGVSAVERTILENWSSPHYVLIHVATHGDGQAWRKLWFAVVGFVRYLCLAVSGKIDIAHVHFSSRASFRRKSLFILVSSCFGIKVIGHAHGAEFRLFYQQECGSLQRAYVRAILGRLDGLIVLSPQWQAFYAELCPHLSPVVIANAVRLPTAALRREAAPPVVATLGRLGQRKGTYDILEAIPTVLTRHPAAQFHFGGDGDVEAVRARLDRVPWGGQVHLLGWLDGEAKSGLLNRAAVFLLPSYNEGLPVALLEAMAHGVAVVTSPVGGIPEVVLDGRTGLLVTPGDVAAIADAVCRLLDDPQLRAQLGGNGRALIEAEYGVVPAIARIAALYGAVCAGPP